MVISIVEISYGNSLWLYLITEPSIDSILGHLGPIKTSQGPTGATLELNRSNEKSLQ